MERDTFGGELRRLRREAGVPLAALADRIHYSKGYLSKVETGVARPNSALAALCDIELGTGGTLAALVDGTSRRPRRQTGATSWTGLPGVTAHFTGRTAEAAEILATLSQDAPDSARICAVDGMAGVGKTMLAVRCARRLEGRFAGGCLYLDLRGYGAGPAEVTVAEALDRFLRALGVPAEQIPSDVDDRAALYRDRLRGRSVLIVLDNARSAHQVMRLVPAEPKCRVLVTSRHRLAALDDAHHVSLGTLTEHESIQLFRSLAVTDGPDEVVAAIVNRCGRLPLAIRIAAARLRTNPAWQLTDLEQRLADDPGRVAELDDGERSVAAAIRLSVADLPDDHRLAFGLLALHPGTDFDIHSAAALIGHSLTTAEHVLGSLHAQHVLTQQPTGRYQFHDLVRSFALAETLPAIPYETQRAALSRLFDLELHAAGTADQLLAHGRYRPRLTLDHLPADVRCFAGHDDALAWFDVEWPNLVALCRKAADSGVAGRSWQLAYHLRSYFFLSKLRDVWINTQQVALAAATADGDVWGEAVTHNNLGLALVDQGELDAASEHYQAAFDRFRQIGDDHGVNTALANFGWVDHYRGDHKAALEHLRAALRGYETTSENRNAAITLRAIALVETALGRYADADTHAHQALTTFQEMDLDLDAAMTLNCLGWIHFNAGDHTAADDAYQRALARSERCGSHYERARAITGLGNIAATAGFLVDARELWGRADGVHSQLAVAVIGEVGARNGLDH
jgi:tetratricopeptide (TPR) repeat protein/transcriptional regulator with XRE-family HTH domain